MGIRLMMVVREVFKIGDRRISWIPGQPVSVPVLWRDWLIRSTKMIVALTNLIPQHNDTDVYAHGGRGVGEMEQRDASNQRHGDRDHDNEALWDRTQINSTIR